MSLPDIPELPQQPTPEQIDAWSRAMRDWEARARVEEYAQRERLIAANTAQTEALNRLLTDGPGTDTAMNERLDAIAQAIATRPSSGGLTTEDVGIVRELAAALRPSA